MSTKKKEPEMSEDKPMTVGELMNALKQLPDNVEVFVIQTTDESSGRTVFLPLDNDMSLSSNNKLELYPVWDSDLSYT
jgi:hypothetical protein